MAWNHCSTHQNNQYCYIEKYESSNWKLGRFMCLCDRIETTCRITQTMKEANCYYRQTTTMTKFLNESIWHFGTKITQKPIVKHQHVIKNRVWTNYVRINGNMEIFVSNLKRNSYSTISLSEIQCPKNWTMQANHVTSATLRQLFGTEAWHYANCPYQNTNIIYLFICTSFDPSLKRSSTTYNTIVTIYCDRLR